MAYHDGSAKARSRASENQRAVMDVNTKGV